MNEQGLRNQVLQSYVDGLNGHWNEIAAAHGATLKDCEREFNDVCRIGEIFRGGTVFEPSQMAINKILAHAREQAEKDAAAFSRKLSRRWQAWLFFRNFSGLRFKPAYAMASLMTAVTVGLLVMQNKVLPVAPSFTVAKTETLTRESTDVSSYSFTTPLDFRHAPALNALPGKKASFGPATLAMPVSFGETAKRLAIDEKLDQKILTKDLLSNKELDTLFFRARESERMGHYEEAFKDYQFISRFYPGYENDRSIQMAMATCLQGLEEKEKAVQVLQRLESKYGASEDINLWIDELKSESF